MLLLSLGHRSHVTSASCSWGETGSKLEILNARYLVVLDKCANASQNKRYSKEQWAGSLKTWFERPGCKTHYLLGCETSEVPIELSEPGFPRLGGGGAWTTVEFC